MTIQYPEEKTPVYPRFRGRHKLHLFEDNGLEKCVGCSLCAAACPADCIRVVAAENDPDDRVSAGERYAAVYEINMARCIFCGYCEVACPFDAITMGHEYELADYNRGDLIFTKEMLLAEPIERTRSWGGRVTQTAASDLLTTFRRGFGPWAAAFNAGDFDRAALALSDDIEQRFPEEFPERSVRGRGAWINSSRSTAATSRPGT